MRRDSCPLAQKILARSIAMLFCGDPDLSKIKVFLVLKFDPRFLF